MDEVLERVALEQLGHHADAPAVHVGAVHEQHIRVLHARERARLLEQPLDRVGLLGRAP